MVRGGGDDAGDGDEERDHGGHETQAVHPDLRRWVPEEPQQEPCNRTAKGSRGCAWRCAAPRGPRWVRGVRD